jgi:hypothetical protein
LVFISILAPARASTIAGRSEFWRSKVLRGAGFALGVYALTRLFVFVAVVIAGRHQVALPNTLFGYHSSVATGTAPGYSTIMTNWDGQWYRQIATHGYPAELPRDASGSVDRNAWGFYPLYPLLVGGLMWVTGLGFTVVGPTVSLVLGAVAVVVLFHLVQDTLGATAAGMATALTCTYITAPVLQAAYTESLALLLLCSALLLLRRRRYLWTVVAIVLLALTRNVVLAMAPVILLHGVYRWRARGHSDFTTRDRVTVCGLAGLCVAAAGLWPGIAAAATGEASAYTQTMAGWGGGLRVFTGWSHPIEELAGPTGLLLFFVSLVLFLALLAQPGARRWGPEIWGWAVAYPLYLVLATAVGSSTPRHVMLGFPLSLLAVDIIRSMNSRIVQRYVLAITVCGGLALQWVWITEFLVVTDTAYHLFP